MDLSGIKPSKDLKKSIITIHGNEKVGKSTFACQFPDALVLDLEKGLSNINVAKFPIEKDRVINDYNEVIEFLQSFKSQNLPYKTLIIDSVTKLESLVFADLCKKHNKASMESWDFQKGYKMATEEFNRIVKFLDQIRTEKDVDVIMICHSVARSEKRPDGVDFNIYDLDVYKDTSALLKRYSDCIGYAHIPLITVTEKGGFGNKTEKVKGDKSTAERMIDFGKNPAYASGNRYGLDTTKLDYNDYNDKLNKLIK